MFCSSVFLILASFGGTAATRPAIVGDLFGLRNVAPLSAMQLSVVLPAAYLGPKIVTTFRERSIKSAIEDLAMKVDDETFKHAFGASKDHLPALIDQKTITSKPLNSSTWHQVLLCPVVSRLMELMPEETVDPSPYLYDSSMFVMAGLQVLALGANLILRPVPEHLHMKKNE